MSTRHRVNTRPASSPAIARRLLALALAGSLAVAGAAHAADSREFSAAMAKFQVAMQGDAQAIEASAELWRKLSAAEPGQPVLRAYAGASTSMMATTVWQPWKKLRHAEDGLALLDKALAQLTPAHDAPAFNGVPASLETRFVAANTFLALPAMFNRGERGARLLAELSASPLLAGSPADFRSAVWMRAAQQALADKRSADARQWLQKVADSGSPQAAAARAQLERL